MSHLWDGLLQASDAGLALLPHHINLRKLARGQPCFIRVPGVCNGNPETTVLCHVRLIGISGIGMKVPDALAAFGCSDCHAVVDGQRRSALTADERWVLLLEGMLRTQAWLIDRGILRW